MTAHAAACATWFLLHLLVAGVWRPALGARLGENGFRGLFSALSAVFLGLMIWTYTQAPVVWLWPSGPASHAVAALGPSSGDSILIWYQP
ncbi:MAG: NnrU family protein [Nevskiales bacterium]